MKTPEDEAFEDIERKQGGFRTKRQMAADKLQEPAQKLVAFLDWYENAIWGNEDFQDGCHRAWDAALEHTPPQRTWVGLTDEEVDECYYWKDRQWTTDELVRHVEAKLKEKNT